MKITLKITRKLILALVAVSVVGTAAAAVTLFTHTFPAISSVNAAITTTCATLTSNATTVLTGSSGHLRFQCGTNPAFTTVGTPPPVTPTFMLSAGYSALYIVAHTDSVCQGVSSQLLTPGTALSNLGTTTPIDYCATFSNAPAAGLATFSVTWTQ